MLLDALTPEERKALILSVGTHRGVRPLSPVEVAELLLKLSKAGATPAACAEALRIGATQITRFLSLLGISEEAQHLIDWGRSDGTIAFTSAFEVSRLSPGADQKEAIRAALEYGFSSSEIRQLVQARKRSTKTIEECVQIILKMRPQVDVHHVLIGTVREDLRDRLRCLSQQRRDDILNTALIGDFADLRVKGRLGFERFTLVGGAALGNAIKSQKDQIEQRLNTALSRALA